MISKLSQLWRRLGRRWWFAGATGIVVVCSVVFVAASGANLTGSTFEGNDGDLVHTGSSTDWDNLAGVNIGIDQPSGSSDNSFGVGTKEDDPAVTVVDGSIPPSKNDLTRFYLASDFSGGNSFVYLSWQRTNTNGDANLDFELNQNPTPGFVGTTTGNVNLVRTAGDLLITYDFGGSGTPALGLLHWLTSGNGDSASDCYSASSLPCWGKHQSLDTSNPAIAEAAVNTATVTDPLNGNASLAGGQFGEAAINLSAVGVFPPNTCEAFGEAWVKSRSSSSFNAEVKDFIAPSPIHVSNCGSIELKKHWVGTPGNAMLNIGTSVGGHETAQASANGDDGTTGANTVLDGTYHVSENVTNSADYTSALACTDNGNQVTPGSNQSLSVTGGHTVVCTFTNTRKTGTIELKKTWQGTAGDVTLDIGSSAGGNDVASTSLSGVNGTTGAQTVNTGTYYVSEAVTDPSIYNSSLSCTDNGQSVTPGANNSLSVADGHAVLCTFNNARKGTIELKKVWVGSKGNVTLKIGSSAGGSQVASTALAAANGTTGAHTVSAGTYYMSESFDSPTSASDYTTTLTCQDNGQAVTPGASDSVSVADTHTVVCTFTNTRKQGSIELRKSWVGTKGAVTLNIGSTAGGSNVATTTLNSSNGTTGPKTVDTGVYYVSESVTNSGDYTSALACTDNGQPVTPGPNSSVTVAKDHTVVCTFTNTRNQGSIELKKVWVGTKSSVTLNISSTVGGHDVAQTALTDNGTTGARTVDTGTYYVAEVVANPANYVSALSCTDNGQPVTPGTNNSVSVRAAHTVICTFTNTRVQGSIEVKKTWVGTAGNVTLKIGSSAGGDDLASQQLTGGDGTTGAKGVDTGTYYVSESFDSPTVPADYSPVLDCTNNGEPVTPGEDGSVTVQTGDHIVCTFTNRELPRVKLTKSLDPATDAGTFDFSIGEQSFTNDGSGYGDQGTTGIVHVQPGSVTVSESGHGDTNLSDYTSSISCSNDQSGTTDLELTGLAYGDEVDCVFTNARKPTITVVKNTLGGDDTFDFTGSDAIGSFQIATSGLTGSKQFTVVPGAYTVTENLSVLSPWKLTGLSCNTGGARSAAGSPTANITVSAGDNVICTFTNTKNATLIVKKVVDNSNGGGSKTAADFSIHVTQAGLDVGGSPQPGSASGTSYALAPGTYKVSEDAVSGYSLTGITGCLSDGSVVLNADATVTCTLTNTSAAPPPPAPPAPPAPKIDLAITKTGAPSPATVGQQVTWTIVVTNNGPNGATGVTMADPIPAGVTFVSVTSTAGTCTGGTMVSCSLGNLAVGQSVTITLVTRAAQTGTITDTATTVGSEEETNTANNTASASVQVKGPFVPAPIVCTALAVSPQQLFVGRKNVLTVRVSQKGKGVAGVRVRVKGSTLRLVTPPSNRKGVVKRAVKPMKAGIVTFVPVARKSCKNPRIGVIGVFTPPVTG